MTITEMIGQSGILTLLGIGVVFLFLIILVFAMHLLHAVVHALKLDKEEPVKKNAAQAASASSAQDNAVIAAIAAAAHEKNL